MDDDSVHHRHAYTGLQQDRRFTGDDIAVEHDGIGGQTGFQHTGAVLQPRRPGQFARSVHDGLFHRQCPVGPERGEGVVVGGDFRVDARYMFASASWGAVGVSSGSGSEIQRPGEAVTGALGPQHLEPVIEYRGIRCKDPAPGDQPSPGHLLSLRCRTTRSP